MGSAYDFLLGIARTPISSMEIKSRTSSIVIIRLGPSNERRHLWLRGWR
jgi:hypothetical protein